VASGNDTHTDDRVDPEADRLTARDSWILDGDLGPYDDLPIRLARRTQ